MVWYSILLKNFPQFVVIHTVKGFGIVNKGEVDVFLEFSCFFDDPAAASDAKSLQLCLTLCNPIDGSPPGSPIPGILQARLQQYVNCELPDVQAGFRKGRGTRDQIANIH